MTNVWDLIKQQLQLVLSEESFHNWFGRTTFSHIDRKTLHVWVPDRQTLLWLENEYAGQVRSLARELGIGVELVQYDIQKEESSYAKMLQVESDGRAGLN